MDALHIYEVTLVVIFGALSVLFYGTIVFFAAKFAIRSEVKRGILSNAAKSNTKHITPVQTVIERFKINEHYKSYTTSDPE